jgi:hypothetical protein
MFMRFTLTTLSIQFVVVSGFAINLPVRQRPIYRALTRSTPLFSGINTGKWGPTMGLEFKAKKSRHSRRSGGSFIGLR